MKKIPYSNLVLFAKHWYGDITGKGFMEDLKVILGETHFVRTDKDVASVLLHILDDHKDVFPNLDLFTFMGKFLNSFQNASFDKDKIFESISLSCIKYFAFISSDAWEVKKPDWVKYPRNESSSHLSDEEIDEIFKKANN